jgi:hypothetical protein
MVFDVGEVSYSCGPNSFCVAFCPGAMFCSSATLAHPYCRASHVCHSQLSSSPCLCHHRTLLRTAQDCLLGLPITQPREKHLFIVKFQSSKCFLLIDISSVTYCLGLCYHQISDKCFNRKKCRNMSECCCLGFSTFVHILCFIIYFES